MQFNSYSNSADAFSHSAQGTIHTEIAAADRNSALYVARQMFMHTSTHKHGNSFVNTRFAFHLLIIFSYSGVIFLVDGFVNWLAQMIFT